MTDTINAGALGIEIKISGKIPSSRAKSWRFYKGYLKKCGDVAMNGIDTAYATANLKMGTIGVQVRIMPPDIKLPDKVKLFVQEESKPAETPVKKEEAEEKTEAKEKPKKVEKKKEKAVEEKKEESAEEASEE
jgi:small subunit ribosomal protein S3